MYYMNKQRYSDETAARAYIAAQIKKGAMIRPEKCEKCGTVGPVHAHHHLGYEMMKRFLPVLVKRLNATRLQLLDVYGKR